jgi:hypothetical protein
MCIQLMQQYVKKSNTTIFPRKSLLKDRGLDTLNHSKSANALVNVNKKQQFLGLHGTSTNCYGCDFLG